jgi:hypothetical protein
MKDFAHISPDGFPLTVRLGIDGRAPEAMSGAFLNLRADSEHQPEHQHLS